MVRNDGVDIYSSLAVILKKVDTPRVHMAAKIAIICIAKDKPLRGSNEWADMVFLRKIINEYVAETGDDSIEIPPIMEYLTKVIPSDTFEKISMQEIKQMPVDSLLGKLAA